MLTVEQRFWPKVAAPDANGCARWLAYRRPDGYGQFWTGERVELAHRFAYRLLVGPIPDGLDLDHLCRIRDCVATCHLEPVTRRENVLRGVGITARLAKRMVCHNGHSLDEANTYHTPRGARNCRRCRADAQRGYVARKKAPA